MHIPNLLTLGSLYFWKPFVGILTFLLLNLLGKRLIFLNLDSRVPQNQLFLMKSSQLFSNHLHIFFSFS